MEGLSPSVEDRAFWEEQRNHRLRGFQIIAAHRDEPGFDSNGSVSSGMFEKYVTLGFAAWYLDRNVAELRKNMVEATEVYLNVFLRFDAGQLSSDAYVSCLAYQQIFPALAAGDFDLATRYAEKMGGRPDSEEKWGKHPVTDFTISMCYMLKYVALGKPKAKIEEWVEKADGATQHRKNKNFAGYPAVCQGLLNHDLDSVQRGFELLLQGHRRECKSNSMLMFGAHEHLCIWGLGLANLCRHRGLIIDPEDPLIPSALLV